MPIREALYRGILRGLRAVAPLFGRGDSKLARGIRGRREAGSALVRWGREERDPDRPAAWFHAPSVGEGFQARAVAQALRERRSDLQVIYTYFSPSARAFAEGMPSGHAGFLPWDLPDEIEPVLDAVRPDVVAFTKTEVWPVLSAAADRRDIPLFLVGGALSPTAGRLRLLARWLLRPSHRRLRAVAAISEDDAGRFPLLGVPSERVVVTGDPGIDSAAERSADADPDAPYLRPFRADPRPTLVAGSTWPPDEGRLVAAATRARRADPRLRLVVAPHEPTREHLEPLVRILEAADWSVRLLAEVEEEGSCGDADAVVVDRVGVLARLYTVGTLAYVGGGFHDEGLHSVLEPAAAALPVVFGPRNSDAGSAAALLDAGAAARARSGDELAEVLEAWLEDPETARRMGRKAREYVDAHRGAAERTAALLLDALSGG